MLLRLLTLTYLMILLTMIAPTGHSRHFDKIFIPGSMIVICVILERKQFSHFDAVSEENRESCSSVKLQKSCLITLYWLDQSKIVLIKSNKIRLSLHLFQLCSSTISIQITHKYRRDSKTYDSFAIKIGNLLAGPS